MRVFVAATALFFAITCNQTFANIDAMQEENKEDIEEVARILRQTVKADLETLFNQHNKLVEQAINVIDKSLNYVDKFAEDLKTHLEKRIDYHNGELSTVRGKHSGYVEQHASNYDKES